jgi:phage anti-repressor protein
MENNQLTKLNTIEGGITDQTPIEIMLQIDEEGKTTARKLYSYLELDKSHLTRWMKKNIIENSFAIENTDFVRFAIDGETPTGGKITIDDYNITANFAKKLCMTSHTSRGEQARNYFIKVEDLLREKIKKNTLVLPNIPYQKFMEQGYFKVIYVPVQMGDRVENTPKTLVSAKGLEFIYKKINETVKIA